MLHERRRTLCGVKHAALHHPRAGLTPGLGVDVAAGHTREGLRGASSKHVVVRVNDDNIVKMVCADARREQSSDAAAPKILSQAVRGHP